MKEAKKARSSPARSSVSTHKKAASKQNSVAKDADMDVDAEGEIEESEWELCPGFENDDDLHGT